MVFIDEIRVETQQFIDLHYPGRGGISKLAREIAPRLNENQKVVAQKFCYYSGQGEGRNPDKYFLDYLMDHLPDHPVSDWACNCLAILYRNGKGLPG